MNHSLGFSDHDIILTTIKSNISYSKPANYNVYLWRHVYLQDMNDDMLNFSSVFTNIHTIETPIEELWSKLRNKLLDIINAYVPSKIKSSSIRHPWINHTLREDVNYKVTTKLDPLIYQHIDISN